MWLLGKEIVLIESISNAQVKRIQKLKRSARYRRQEKCFIVEGFKMVDEALRYEKVQKIYVSEEAGDEYEEKLSHKITKDLIEWVSSAVFREISDTATPQGVLALAEMPEYDQEELEKKEEAAFICLEDIQDPGNLGTIMRTAEGAGMTAVVMSKGCVDLFNPKVVRSTMGALFRLPFYVIEDMTTEVERLQKKGFTMYAASLDAKRDYTGYHYTGKTGILIGNEANGLKPETSALADERLIIPMEGEVESLNAAVSAALLMYEVHRNRVCKNAQDIVK